MVEDKLADMILDGSLSAGDRVKLTTSLKPSVEAPDGESSELCFDKLVKPEKETVSC
jgi:hypothetical protein